MAWQHGALTDAMTVITANCCPAYYLDRVNKGVMHTTHLIPIARLYSGEVGDNGGELRNGGTVETSGEYLMYWMAQDIANAHFVKTLQLFFFFLEIFPFHCSYNNTMASMASVRYSHMINQNVILANQPLCMFKATQTIHVHVCKYDYRNPISYASCALCTHWTYPHRSRCILRSLNRI